jgi:membrane fusion protein (multidrug efflux system)
MRTQTSGVTVREKARQALKSDLDFAKLELDRTKTLFATRVVNERQLQTAQAAVTKLEIQLLQMEAEHEQAEGSLNEARAGQERLHVIDAQIEALTHQVANLAAQMHQQQVDVEDRTIKSPVPAVIDRTFMLPASTWRGSAHPDAAQPQRSLGRGQHQGDTGRPAEARPARQRDGRCYPGVKFIGKVARIGNATTARFALLPTPILPATSPRSPSAWP